MMAKRDFFSTATKHHCWAMFAHLAWRYRESSPDSSEMHRIVALTRDALEEHRDIYRNGGISEVSLATGVE